MYTLKETTLKDRSYSTGILMTEIPIIEELSSLKIILNVTVQAGKKSRQNIVHQKQ